MGSVSTNVLEHSQFIPIWLVDEEITSDKILVAVDGSESSLRAIDHISFMVMGNSNAKVTLLHVMSKAREFYEESLEEEPSKELAELIKAFLWAVYHTMLSTRHPAVRCGWFHKEIAAKNSLHQAAPPSLKPLVA
jgi:hypothetical protein